MDFQCDLYCYESDFGYEIHVAGNRILGDIPHVPVPSTSVSDLEWQVAYLRQHEFLATAQHEPITLPYAGESFTDVDLEALEARLLMLRDIGYRFPDEVLEAIRAEMEDE